MSVNQLRPVLDEVYASGPLEMIDAAKKQFFQQGLSEDDFYSDAFTFAKDKAASTSKPPGKGGLFIPTR